MTIGSAVRRFIFVSLGYCCAVAVAVVATLIVNFGYEAAAAPANAMGANVAGVFLMGYYITFPTALPGFLVVLGLALAMKWRGWLPFALAGALNVIPAFWLLDQFLGGVGASSMLRTALPLYSLPGGFAGGLVYWLVANRWGNAA